MRRMVRLGDLEANPFRDNKIDPMTTPNTDEDESGLEESIKKHGLWDGVIVRETSDGRLQIAAGHRRTFYAMKHGHDYANLEIRKLTDEEMIEIYGTENVTQRGSVGVAVTGAIGAAVRYLAKGVLTNDPNVGKFFPTSNGNHALDTIRGQITTEKGLGWSAVQRFFKDVKRMNEGVVREHLTQLKQSGHYARIIKEVGLEIEAELDAEREKQAQLEKEAELKRLAAEQAEADAAAAKLKAEQDATAKAEAKQAKAEAKKAELEAKEAEAKANEQAAIKAAADKAAKAAKQPVTWDLDNVKKWLPKANQQKTFRRVLQREQLQKHIPVSKQKDLAALLVHYAIKHNKGKLTAQFIEGYLTEIIVKGDVKNLKLDDGELINIQHEHYVSEFHAASQKFISHVNGMMREATRMLELKDRYSHLQFDVTQDFLDAIHMARPQINKLAQKFC